MFRRSLIPRTTRRSACLPVIACVVMAGSTAVAQDAPSAFTAGDFLGPVFAEQDGLIIIEPEDLPLSDKWELRTDAGTGDGDGAEQPNSDQPATHTGRGYVRWLGPHQGMGHDEDEHHQFQGDHRDWIVMKVHVTRPGPYRVDVRNFHRYRDGDNDVWVGRIGQHEPVKRMADRHTNWYTWVDWDAAKTVVLEPGLNAVYLAGRSRGFGTDRVAIFSSDREHDARDPSLPASPVVNTGDPLPLISIERKAGVAPLTMTLDGSGSRDDGRITASRWVIGDQVLHGAQVSHTFATPGVHRVRLVVTDDTGRSTSTSRQVTVLDPEDIGARLPRVQSTDGSLADAPAHAVTTRVSEDEQITPASVRGQWRGGWDDDALYLMIDVEDDTVLRAADPIWEGDSVEIFVDADASRSGAYGRNDRQFLVPAEGGGVFTPAGESLPETNAASQKTDSGYRLTVTLPWSILGLSPASGDLIGLEIHINDDDGGDGRDAKLSWHGDDRAAEAWRDPRVFGIVQLQR